MVLQSRPLYSDKDLISFLQQDDRRGIEIIFKQYHKRLFKFVFHIIKQHGTSEDIVLEVFSNLWKVRHNLNENVAIKPYLYKAAKNRALNKLRKEDRNQLMAEFPENIHELAMDTNQIIEAKELKHKIRVAINLLPPKCQLIFKLSRFEDMTYAEIAEHLDISIKTVENQMIKALKTIRKYLEAYFKGDI